MSHFIYVLKCPFADVVRYIGKTDHPQHRLRQHIGKARSGDTRHHCANWINGLITQEAQPKFEVLCELPLGANWQAVERLLIGFCRISGIDVTNVTAGGEGVTFTDADARRRQVDGRRTTMASPEIRERWRVALRSANTRPDVQARRSAAAKAVWSDEDKRAALLAAACTPQARERKSMAMKTNWQDADYARRMKTLAKLRMQEPGAVDRLSAALAAADANPEHRAKRIAAATATKRTADGRDRQSAAAAEVNARPEVKASKSAAMKAAWADPAQRAEREASLALAKPAMSAARKAIWADPEKAATLKAAQKAAWADPAKKAARLAKREAMWADPVQRAALIEKQRAAWIRRKERTASCTTEPDTSKL